MHTRFISIFAGILGMSLLPHALPSLAAETNSAERTFGKDAEFLASHVETIVLGEDPGGPRVAGETGEHLQETCHFEGDAAVLDGLSKKLLGVSLEEIEAALE